MGMAERIKELRLAAGMSQEDLGLKLGLGKSAIAKYENDGDIVFILRDCDFITGQIYAVEFKDSRDAVLKKVEQDGENIILIPCNPAYHTMVTDYEEIRIVGRCVGVYHSYV